MDMASLPAANARESPVAAVTMAFRTTECPHRLDAPQPYIGNPLGRRQEPRTISEAEVKRISGVIDLAVRLRGPVERNRRTSEIEAVYGAEGTGRLRN